ncbi:MAG: aromatic ring-hydroxylating oxygenase subunit alpha [Planctomycetota bacterium]
MNTDTEARIQAEFEHARAGGDPPPFDGDVSEARARDYFDERTFADELRDVFRRAWVPIARASEVAARGAFATAEIAGSPLVVIGGDDGRARVLHNACKHRGTQIVRAERGTVAELRCPYHGFTYALDGRWTSAPHVEVADVRGGIGDLKLDAVDSVSWNGWICARLAHDDLAPGAQFFDASLTDELVHWELARAEVKDRRSIDVDFNWKIGVEAFLEPLHVPAIHARTVHPVVEIRASAMRSFGPHSRMALAFRSPRTFEPDGPMGRAAAEQGVVAPVRLNGVQRTSNFSYLLFPCTVLNFLPTHFTLYRMLPLTPKRTRVTYELYGMPAESDAQRAYYESLRAGYDAILAEDLENLPWIQRGLEGGSLERLALTSHERRIRHFHASLARWRAGATTS